MRAMAFVGSCIDGELMEMMVDGEGGSRGENEC